MRIREKDGIHIEAERKIVADSRNASGDLNFVSHAHFDHLHVEENAKVVASEVTARLASERNGKNLKVSEDDRTSMLDAGHIIGSKAGLFQVDGKKVLYTGDFSTRDRLYLDGFDPVDADILVMESTYGLPSYRFPDHAELEKRIRDWLHENSDKSLFLFGYSLGKAQKIQKIVEKYTDRTIVAHGAVKNMNDAVEKVSDLEFSAVPYSENKDLVESGEAVLVGPTRFSRSDALEKLVERTSGIKAGFSGWALNDSFRFQGDYDVGFPLSDHADFEELVETARKVDPEKVYITHGFAEPLASHLKSELGMDARPLEKNQTSLSEF